MIVKIEGLMDLPTALEVCRLGADWIGMVFAPSPRQIDADKARLIAAALPARVKTVGVFVNAPAEHINNVVATAGLTYVQLHGDEGPETVGQIKLPCIKAFHVRGPDWLDTVNRWLDGVADRSRLAAILLDAYNPAVRGGSGQRFNWDMVAARARGRLADIGPIVLAGGLDPDCVADAIAKVQPMAVDVASGVESSPGVKDLLKVQRFIDAARASEGQTRRRGDAKTRR
jgi:phosphoribosylanthranilate isomerase